jgi:hypothetical protein
VVDQPTDLVAQCLHQGGVSVAQGIDLNSGETIQVTLAVCIK